MRSFSATVCIFHALVHKVIAHCQTSIIISLIFASSLPSVYSSAPHTLHSCRQRHLHLYLCITPALATYCSSSLSLGSAFLPRGSVPAPSRLRHLLHFYSPSSLSRRRSLSMAASAQSSTEATLKESGKCFEFPSGRTVLEMTFLEGNSWLWTVNGVNILVDPVLVGNLDFGIPFLYDAAKKSKFMKEFTLDDLPKLDCILITQGLDDHCHKKTLTAMVEKFGEVRIIASPNTEPIIAKIGYKNVTYLEPRNSTMLGDIRIRASEGPVLGLPWRRPENGYFLEILDPKFVIYYEPHCVFGKASLDKERADVMVTPVNKLVLPGFTLISGQEDAVQLAKYLQPKYVVTMQNAELDTRGVLSLMISEKGTVDAFKEMLAKEIPNCQVLEPTPGTPLEVPVLNVVRQ